MKLHYFLVMLAYHFHHIEAHQPYANHAQCFQAARQLNTGVIHGAVWRCWGYRVVPHGWDE